MMKPYYEQDGITIYHGKAEEVLPTLPTCEAVVTDPPYLNDEDGVVLSHPGVGPVVNPTASVTNPWGYSLGWIEEAAKLEPYHWIVFANYKMLGGLLSAIERHAQISCVFAWRKPNAPNPSRPVPRMDCEFIAWARAKGEPCGRMGEFRSQVIDYPNLSTGCFASSERIMLPGTTLAAHRCQKPLAVVTPFVARLPVKDVVDPFCGTGTTLVACKACGIGATGIEQEERYCEIAAKRLAQGVLFGAGGAA
jgi:site-specific DNA-methyltransferase (adenine-specific)